MQACNLLRHSTEDKISYIFYIFLSRVVLELRRENEIAENKNWSFFGDRNWGSDRSSTAIAETNGENPMKIHPVEDAIVGLTEIVKKERNDTEAKHLATR